MIWMPKVDRAERNANIATDAEANGWSYEQRGEVDLTAYRGFMAFRGVDRLLAVKNLVRGTAVPAANSTVRQEIALQQGIPTEKAKDIVKFLKDAKLKKVQATIQGDQLRVTSSSKDDLQEAMRLLREQDFGVALQFGNYRG